MPLKILNYDEDAFTFTEYEVTEEGGKQYAQQVGEASPRFLLPPLEEREQLDLLHGYYEQVAETGEDYLQRLPAELKTNDEVRQAARQALDHWSEDFHWGDRVKAQSNSGTVRMVEPGLRKALVSFDGPEQGRGEGWFRYEELGHL